MKFILTILLIGQFLMAAKIEQLKVHNTQIPLLVEQDKRLPLITMQFIFTNSGSITDDKKAGLAKLSAKLLNQGTKTKGASLFANELEARAISLSCNVGTETFVIELSCLKEEFPYALKHLQELLKEPNLTKETLQKIQKMTVGSLSRKKDDFDYVASKELKSILFADTVLQNPASGSIKSVQSITLIEIQTFLNTHLSYSNLIVLLGGDIEIKKVKKQLSNVIEILPATKITKLKHYNATSTSKESILNKNTQQAYLYFGSPFNMLVDDKDSYKAKVATYILGAGGFGSRLMEEIRVKRGLAYSAYARTTLTKSRSYFSGYLQTKIESLDEAKKTVNDVIADFVKNGVSKEELKQTKKFLLGSEPLRVETMSQRLNRSFQEYYKGQKLGSSKDELEKIEMLTLQELNEFIKKHAEITNLSFAIVTKLNDSKETPTP